MKEDRQPPLAHIHALGDFSLSVKLLAKKLHAQGVKLHLVSSLKQGSLPQGNDYLLSELTWLETLDSAQHALLLNKAKTFKYWIVILDDKSATQQQRFWLNCGVHRFIHLDHAHKQLADFVIDECSRNNSEISAYIFTDNENLDSFIDVLEQEKVAVEVGRSKNLALEVLLQGKPSILIIDLSGSKSEMECVLHVLAQRAKALDIPVLLLLTECCALKLYQEGVLDRVDWISKPIAPQLLASIIRQRVSLTLSHKRTLKNSSLAADSARNRLRNLRFAIDQHATVSIADVKGQILHVNHRFCEISGYSRDELIGNNHRILKSGLHKSEFYQCLWETIRNGKTWRGEVCNRRKSGELYWVAATIVPLLNEQGKPAQYFSIRTDITARKASEKALQISNDRLQRSQIAGRVGTWEFDMVSRKFQLSSSILSLFGRTEEFGDLSYENYFRYIYADDIPLVLSSIEDMLANRKNYEVEHRVIWPDGTLHWLLQRGAAEFDADGEPVRLIGITQDIHALKITEQTLLESEIRFRGAFDTSGIGMAIVSLSGRWLQVNKALCDILNFTESELLSLDVQSVTYPDDIADYQAIINNFSRGGSSSQQFEKRYISKDKRIVVALVNISLVYNSIRQPVHIVCQIQDVTLRKLTERRLTLFGQIFESSEQCISVADERGILLYQNNAQRRELGYEDVECFGKTFEMLIPEESGFSKILWRNFSEGFNWQGLLPLRRKDGTEFISNSHIGLVKDGHGQTQYMFNIFTDFSEEIARREELNQARIAADAANQAKTDFLSSMSHELRTPMNAILGFAQLLECDDSLNADQLDSVQEILNGGHHLLELINEVLDLAKVESGTLELSMEPVALECIVAECWSLIQPLAEARHLSFKFIASGAYTALADRTRLKQVLFNLLSNAVKYNVDDGQVIVSLLHCSPEIIRIEVSDTGIGIPFVRINELFHPFSRLNAECSEIEGTGIGLSIAQRLVILMGGQIGVKSTEGQGSTFWLELCVAEEDKQGTNMLTLLSDKIQNYEKEKRKVLCIDDNPINLKLVNNFIAKYPYIKFYTASSASLGLEIAMAEKPDLILLDINMPVMNGYQLHSILRAESRTSSIPIVAVTANAMPIDVERAQNSGFDDYLTKPLDFHQLHELLNHYLGPDTEDRE